MIMITIETRLSICSANKLTGFYMMANLAFNELIAVNYFHKNLKRLPGI